MKKLITICAVSAMLLAASPVQAVPLEQEVTFDFEGATTGGTPNIGGTADLNVTNYMTSVYGSSVTSTGAAAWENSMAGDDWPFKSDTDQWLRSYGAVGYTQTPGVFQISFDDVPIIGISGDFFVFESTGNEDFVVKAYNNNYSNRYNPISGAFVAGYSSNGTGSGSFNISFSSPVSLLVFSDSGYYDIAIDNLAVTPIPEPGTLLLLGLGGLFLRRRSGQVLRKRK